MKGVQTRLKLLIVGANILRPLLAMQGLEPGALGHRLIVIGRGPGRGTKPVKGRLNG